MSDQPPMPILSCGCVATDAWRCASARILPTVSCHCSCHRTATEVNAEQSREGQRAQVINSLNFMNSHGVASGAGGKRLVMLIPPTRATEWTPEQALVLAGWLVALAEPFAQISFADVLDQIHKGG